MDSQRRRSVLLSALTALAVLVVAFPLGIWTGHQTSSNHIFVVTATPSQSSGPPSTPSSARLKSTYGLLYYASVGRALFQPTCTNTIVVESAYWTEANLLDYSIPVSDIDYQHPYGAQCEVRLPGYKTDIYHYLGSVCIGYGYYCTGGSGWVWKGETPNGGHFAFAHLGVLFTSVLGMPSILPHRATQPTVTPEITVLPTPTGTVIVTDLMTNDVGDLRMAEDIGNVTTTPPGLRSTALPGGATIGKSRWPDDPYYGNGVGGPYNAHLCLILDSAAADWFYAIASGHHPRPKARPKPKFPIRSWGRHVSPYQCSTLRHRRVCSLTWAADWAWKHHLFRYLGEALDRGHYYGYGKTRADPHPHPYTQTRFRRGVLRCWNHWHRCEAARR